MASPPPHANAQYGKRRVHVVGLDLDRVPQRQHLGRPGGGGSPRGRAPAETGCDAGRRRGARWPRRHSIAAQPAWRTRPPSGRMSCARCSWRRPGTAHGCSSSCAENIQQLGGRRVPAARIGPGRHQKEAAPWHSNRSSPRSSARRPSRPVPRPRRPNRWARRAISSSRRRVVEQSQRIAAGADVTVILCSNPSTGFSWDEPQLGDSSRAPGRRSHVSGAGRRQPPDRRGSRRRGPDDSRPGGRDHDPLDRLQPAVGWWHEGASGHTACRSRSSRHGRPSRPVHMRPRASRGPPLQPLGVQRPTSRSTIGEVTVGTALRTLARCPPSPE